MLINTRFGVSETREEKIITFPSGLPGLEGLHQFIIIEADNTKPVYWLQSTENQHIALPVMMSFAILDDYNLNIREDELEGLDVESKDDLLILNVLVIPEDVRKMTANLAAPIVIDARHGVGKQIIIDAEVLPLRFPVYEAIKKSLKGDKKDVSAVT